MSENIFDLIAVQEKMEISNIISCNEYTKKYGLILKDEDVKALIEDKKYVLKNSQRVEFGQGVMPKLIYTFCDSSYIYQDNYVESMARLQEIFYTYKNETRDILTDDELIAYMKEYFEGECQGSLDYLEETCLQKISCKISRGEILRREME